jgi:predicted nuclease with TOPRIM domain
MVIVVTTEAVFTVEEKEKLQRLTEEVPKLRLRMEELEETLEILSDKNLMRHIRAGQKDIDEKRLYSWEEALKELGVNEEDL